MLRTLLITWLVSKGVKEFFRAAVLLILMAVKTAAISDIFNIQTRHKKNTEEGAILKGEIGASGFHASFGMKALNDHYFENHLCDIFIALKKIIKSHCVVGNPYS